jgi:hypothetical protein
MPRENMHYRLKIVYDVKIAKWRIDDQNIVENREWSLRVFDRNKELWLPVRDLNRPGEYAKLMSIEVLEE